MRHTGNYKISAELKTKPKLYVSSHDSGALKTIMKPLVSAMFSASLKFMAKLKVSIYFSVQLKFCIFQCDYRWHMLRDADISNALPDNTSNVTQTVFGDLQHKYPSFH